jgi:hypothetical protein
MQSPLHKLEDHLLRGAVDCAAILGVSYSNYAAMKAGSRTTPRYVAFHIEALVALPLDVMHGIVKKRLAPKKTKR